MNAIVSSTSGRIGGILGQSHTRQLVAATHEWLEGGLSLQEIRDTELLIPHRRSLSMVVNNECNLSCSHCYLQIPRLSGERLEPSEWTKLIRSAVRDGVEQFLLVGKEVLLGKTGPSVLATLGELSVEYPQIRVGAITNGTLLHEHFDLVERVGLHHLDISMEGDREDHDAIRGTGAFDAVRSNVTEAVKLLGERLFIAMTLQKRNIGRVGEALIAFDRLGVKSVALSPYEVLPYTDPSLTLSSRDYHEFFENLDQIGDLPLSRDMMVQIDACATSPEMLCHFMESDWFDLNSMVANGSGFLYLHRRLENGVILSFRFQPWPLSFDFHARIAANGTMVCASDVYRVRSYELNRLANVRELDFDFPAAANAASMHPRLALVDSKFDSELTPLIREAYNRTSGTSGKGQQVGNRCAAESALTPAHN